MSLDPRHIPPGAFWRSRRGLRFLWSVASPRLGGSLSDRSVLSAFAIVTVLFNETGITDIRLHVVLLIILVISSIVIIIVCISILVVELFAVSALVFAEHDYIKCFESFMHFHIFLRVVNIYQTTFILIRIYRTSFRAFSGSTFSNAPGK